MEALQAVSKEDIHKLMVLLAFDAYGDHARDISAKQAWEHKTASQYRLEANR